MCGGRVRQINIHGLPHTFAEGGPSAPTLLPPAPPLQAWGSLASPRASAVSTATASAMPSTDSATTAAQLRVLLVAAELAEEEARELAEAEARELAQQQQQQQQQQQPRAPPFGG